MAGSNTRKRFSAFAFKVETTPGVDAIAGSPSVGDFVLGSGNFTLNPQLIQDPSFTGSLDTAPGAVGAFMPQISLAVPLRGSGAAGTAPSFGKLLRACGMEEIIDPVGITAAALTAGSENTGTLGTGYGTTAQAYRGLPAILAGNPASGAITPILNYTTGKVATFGEAFDPELDDDTTCAIPPHVLYRAIDDEASMKWGTLYAYEDGLVTKFTGCLGDVRLDLTSGNSGMLNFTFRGKFGGVETAAVPTVLTQGTAVSLPIWVGGRARLGADVMRCRALNFALGNQVVMPDNPEAADGYDPGVILSRNVVTSLDPSVDTTKQVQLVDDFKAGTAKPLWARIGVAAGNRFLVCQPSVRQMAGDPGDRGGLGTNQIRAEANLPGAPIFLCAF